MLQITMVTWIAVDTEVLIRLVACTILITQGHSSVSTDGTQNAKGHKFWLLGGENAADPL